MLGFSAMKRLLLVVALLLLLVACAGGGEVSAHSEKGLRKQLNTMWLAYQVENYDKLYTYLSDDVRGHCTLEQFKAQSKLVRGSLGDNFFRSKLLVDDVQIDGDSASYNSTYILNGAVLS